MKLIVIYSYTRKSLLVYAAHVRDFWLWDYGIKHNLLKKTMSKVLLIYSCLYQNISLAEQNFRSWYCLKYNLEQC
jgi:hypothetical protein